MSTTTYLDEIEGFGASYNRDDDCWHVYTMPGTRPFCILKGYDKGRLDVVMDTLRLAHRLNTEVAQLREALNRDATRFGHCAVMIAQSFNASGALRAERAIKAEHYALEARAAAVAAHGHELEE